MGQKVNPVGLRLGIVKGWDSAWFGGKDFSAKIVEDHKINQIVATKFLKKYQCEIDIAENGLEAVKLIEAKTDYDLILMDLEMPVMNGYEAAIAIREIEKDSTQTPIVALSANALLDVSKKVQEAGMNGYISKPFEAGHFYAQIADNIR